MNENKNSQYRELIRRLIDQTEDTHILCCIYTIAIRYLRKAAEEGGAI